MYDWEIQRYMFQFGSRDILLFHLKNFLRSRPYILSNLNGQAIFDTSLQTALAEYQRHHRLSVADGTLNKETYAAIGKEMSITQINAQTLSRTFDVGKFRSKNRFIRERSNAI